MAKENNTITCPYCQNNYNAFYMSHKNDSNINLGTINTFYFNIHRCLRDCIMYSSDKVYKIFITRCPSCGGETIHISSFDIEENPDSNIMDNIDCRYIVTENNAVFSNVLPSSFAIAFPGYIPEAIRNDYEEACKILTLSPKASATLARRCLQGMIRDFWGIKKDRLIDEINELNGKVTAAQWQAVDALRKIGNIGAHMEKDVNTIIDVDRDEAETLIRFIEILIDQWYIDRHKQEVLYNEIINIKNEKDKEKKGGGCAVTT